MANGSSRGGHLNAHQTCVAVHRFSVQEKLKRTVMDRQRPSGVGGRQAGNATILGVEDQLDVVKLWGPTHHHLHRYNEVSVRKATFGSGL